MTGYVLGADGGGTKTLGILADLSGKEIARHQVGPGNPNVAGVDRASANLLELMSRCCDAGRIHLSEVRVAVFGLAGVGSTPIREQLRDAVVSQLEAKDGGLPEVHLETDARIALEGAFGGAPGAIVIAGTGSIVLGKTATEEGFTVGGWGRVLGDEGSGYFLGVEALRAVARNLDARTPSGRLSALLAEVHGWTTRDHLIAAVYHQKFDIPALAPLVLRAAEEGDACAIDILERGARLLTEQIGVVAGRLQQEDRVRIALMGGLIGNDTVYARIVREHLHRQFPRVDVRPPMASPAEGAVLMALRFLHER